MHFHNPNESIPKEHIEYKSGKYKQFSKMYYIVGITIFLNLENCSLFSTFLFITFFSGMIRLDFQSGFHMF